MNAERQKKRMQVQCGHHDDEHRGQRAVFPDEVHNELGKPHAGERRGSDGQVRERNQQQHEQCKKPVRWAYDAPGGRECEPARFEHSDAPTRLSRLHDNDEGAHLEKGSER